MIVLDILIFLGVVVVGACCWMAGFYTGKLASKKK